jgi:hypothetical protein
VPAFGAYDLAVTLLFPFVAIRLVSAEKESGALKLSLQFPAELKTIVTAKGLALVLAWCLAWLPGLAVLVLWKSYGGHLYGPETWNLIAGHMLHMLLAAGLSVAAAAIAESAASAAIATLGITLGTWALDFVAAARGGLLQELAAYTPTAALRVFEQGLLRLNVVVVMVTLSLGGFSLAAVWLHTGRGLRVRLPGAVALALTLAAVIWTGARFRQSWDLSEDRRNSFSPSDEAALAQIREPLRVTVFLAAEDPRLMDLEKSILTRLKRILPDVAVDYASTSRSGLFEGADDHYGEIWYAIGDRKVMTRSTTEAIVLEQIYQLAKLDPPERSEENGFPGYPLAARPRGAQWIFYMVWPLSIIAAWWLINK